MMAPPSLRTPSHRPDQRETRQYQTVLLVYLSQAARQGHESVKESSMLIELNDINRIHIDTKTARLLMAGLIADRYVTVTTVGNNGYGDVTYYGITKEGESFAASSNLDFLRQIIRIL